MGRAKQDMMEWEELGITPSDASNKAVCAECIEDYHLQEFVNANLDSDAWEDSGGHRSFDLMRSGIWGLGRRDLSVRWAFCGEKLASAA